MSTNRKPVNILCLDGGGIRGLSSLLILRDLMEQLNRSSKRPTNLEPCEVFDMICGTSTGGLSAIMLGRLRMTLEDTIENYNKFAEEVFGRRVAKAFSWYGLGYADKNQASLYDASKLANWTKELVAKYEQDPHLKDPNDGTKYCCHTFVVAVAEATWDMPAKRFKSYSTKKEAATPCEIWEAVRATTAAVPFFPPMTLKAPDEVKYIDGSYGSNNPSQHAMEEFRNVFPSRKLGCLLSLGTGVTDVISAYSRADKVAQACVRLARSSELIHDAVGTHLSKTTEYAVRDAYFRFSVPRGVGKIKVDGWEHHKEVNGITNGYMRQYEQKRDGQKLVDKLKERVQESLLVREDKSML